MALNPKTGRPINGDTTIVVFREWLTHRMKYIKHIPKCIVLYKVGNTLIRRIKLHNGEVIETRIVEKGGKL